MTAMECMREVVRQAATTEPTDGDADLHSFLAHAKGVIHVGGNVGEERDLYASFDLPVLWIEPMPLVFDALLENLAGYRKQFALPWLITDASGRKYKFGVASNACQSSSIFDFAEHKKLWPEVGYVASVEMESRTLANAFENYSLPDMDILVLDVQGAELLALKGAGDYLERFRWILAEAADFESYRGGCQLKDLDDYLLPRGFVREKTVEFFSKPGVGSYFNVLYKGAA